MDADGGLKKPKRWSSGGEEEPHRESHRDRGKKRSFRTELNSQTGSNCSIRDEAAGRDRANYERERVKNALAGFANVFVMNERDVVCLIPKHMFKSSCACLGTSLTRELGSLPDVFGGSGHVLPESLKVLQLATLYSDRCKVEQELLRSGKQTDIYMHGMFFTINVHVLLQAQVLTYLHAHRCMSLTHGKVDAFTLFAIAHSEGYFRTERRILDLNGWCVLPSFVNDELVQNKVAEIENAEPDRICKWERMDSFFEWISKSLSENLGVYHKWNVVSSCGEEKCPADEKVEAGKPGRLPGYVCLVTLEGEIPIWICARSHFHVGENPQSKRGLANSFFLEKVIIPPQSIVFLRGDVTYASASAGDQSMEGHDWCLYYKLKLGREGCAIVKGSAPGIYLDVGFRESATTLAQVDEQQAAPPQKKAAEQWCPGRPCVT